jgi:hypothetical protein
MLAISFSFECEPRLVLQGAMPVEEDAPSVEDIGKYDRLPVPLVTECTRAAQVIQDQQRTPPYTPP